MSITGYYSSLDVPTTLLGLKCRSWKRSQIRLILDHYSWKWDSNFSTKIDLTHQLHLLVQEYELDRRDRKRIFNAHKRGEPLPPRKPRVRRVRRPPYPVLNDVSDLRSAQRQARARTTSQPMLVPTNLDILQATKNHSSTKSRPNAASFSPADCEVCFETLNGQNTPKRKTTFSCSHEPNVCRSCLATSIATQVNNKVWDQIDCPSCGQRLHFRDVKKFADPIVFERLESLYNPNPETLTY